MRIIIGYYDANGKWVTTAELDFSPGWWICDMYQVKFSGVSPYPNLISIAAVASSPEQDAQLMSLWYKLEASRDFFLSHTIVNNCWVPVIMFWDYGVLLRRPQGPHAGTANMFAVAIVQRSIQSAEQKRPVRFAEQVSVLLR